MSGHYNTEKKALTIRSHRCPTGFLSIDPSLLSCQRGDNMGKKAGMIWLLDKKPIKTTHNPPKSPIFALSLEDNILDYSILAVVTNHLKFQIYEKIRSFFDPIRSRLLHLQFLCLLLRIKEYYSPDFQFTSVILFHLYRSRWDFLLAADTPQTL